MSNEDSGPKPIAFIRELCKHKSEAEILEAEETFREYLLLVKSMCQRIEDEEQSTGAFDKA